MVELKDLDKLKFPNNFFWGASISSHQVEGGVFNNWTEWEKKNSNRLALESKNRSWLRNWSEIKDFASDPNNYISGSGADHYNRYLEDFTLAKNLNLNAIRFSFEWSRIQPNESTFDKEAINHYKRYVFKLKEFGFEPFATIWHWSLPIWFEGKGGFENPENLRYFEKYVEILANEFSQDIKFWIVHNEPRIYTSESFLNGRWPPQKKSVFTYLKVLMNLQKAHFKAYDILKLINPNLQIGIAENIASYTSKGNIFDQLARIIFNWYELRIIRMYKSKLDFIGLNYYFHRHLNKLRLSKLGEDINTSDLGWELYPQGIKSPLLKLKSMGKPIIITENGLADSKDKHRSWFLKLTIKSIAETIRDGVDVRGYLHWSLIDNFEWDSGFWPRFGLIEIDFKNKSRKIRKSGFLYSEIIQLFSQQQNDLSQKS